MYLLMISLIFVKVRVAGMQPGGIGIQTAGVLHLIKFLRLMYNATLILVGSKKFNSFYPLGRLRMSGGLFQ